MDIDYVTEKCRVVCSFLKVDFVKVIENHILEDGMYKRKGQYTHIYHIDYKIELKYNDKNLTIPYSDLSSIYLFALSNNLMGKSFEEIYILWKIR